MTVAHAQRDLRPRFVTASYKDGILEIRAPIAAEEEKPPVTKVPVSRG